MTQSSDQLGELVWELGMHDEWIHLDSEELYVRLRDMGKLPVHDMVLEWANVDG
ncbi:hypothetical protein DFR69_104261 [Nocardia neocaledoniensis]|uniref:Uncharacterized protein n=2 Tax=Nocardiaceae TaxID=85025 RepID=A0A317NR13_9NOCA|nr:hypothetical protein DFR69_104261 [Nocardia neocaledoniensis]